ncbi:MAG: hypothetical protein EA356_02880 [Geminicoccaceae bacterium]|nr:MAG: hypothetical protein EA356_02880 [Geminicoccaceae bacterium]
MTGERTPHPLVALLFGGSKTDRLGRLDFAKGIGFVLGALALNSAIIAGTVWLGEALIGEEPPSLWVLALQVLGFLIAGFVACAVVLLAFAFFNLIGKRMRDLGLPGWKSVAVATMLGTAFSFAAPPVATLTYIVVVWALLLGLPSSPRPYVYVEPK